MSARTQIQAALINLGRAGTFHKVSYDSVNIPTTSDETATPKSCLANETASGFSVDQKYGRKIISRREGWRFTLLLNFDEEVDAGDFEESVMDTTIQIAGINSTSYLAVITSAEYNHPVTKEPSRGTEIRYGFNIIPTHQGA